MRVCRLYFECALAQAFTGAAFRREHCRAQRRQNGEDVLEEVELFVAG